MWREAGAAAPLTTNDRGYGFRARCFASPRNDDGGLRDAARQGRDGCPSLRHNGTTGKIPLHADPKSVAMSAIPFRQEGRIAIVTNAGRGCGGRESVGAQGPAGRVEPRERLQGAQDDDVSSVRQNRVVPTPVAGAKSAVTLRARPGLKVTKPPTTVTRRIRRRGEQGISRQAITQGMPGASAEPVCSGAPFLSHCA